MIQAKNAGLPVMLSETPTARPGRPVNGSSSIAQSQSTSTYYGYNATVSVTTTRTSQSELGASTKLMVGVNRNERWVQVTGAEYSGYDYAGYGYSNATRSLSINGEAHR